MIQNSNRTAVIHLHTTNQNHPNESCAPKTLFVYDPENEIYFAITSEISKLGRFIYFKYYQRTKITILLNFRVSYNQ